MGAFRTDGVSKVKVKVVGNSVKSSGSLRESDAVCAVVCFGLCGLL